MLAFIRAGLDHHASTCPVAPRAILLHPGNHELFGWSELWGIPVVADERVDSKRFRIDCPGSAFGIEDEVSRMLAELAPLAAEQPAAAQRPQPGL